MILRALTLVTPPATEPVTAAEAALEARCSATDARMLSYLKPARRAVEQLVGRALITQTWKATYSGCPGWNHQLVLPFPPLVSVSSVKYLDWAGAETTLDSSAYVATVSAGEEADHGHLTPANGTYWPWMSAGDVTIQFVCGYGAVVAVPDALKLAVCRRVGQLDDGSVDDSAIRAICGGYIPERLA